jgi:hypothetical protein
MGMEDDQENWTATSSEMYRPYPVSPQQRFRIDLQRSNLSLGDERVSFQSTSTHQDNYSRPQTGNNNNLTSPKEYLVNGHSLRQTHFTLGTDDLTRASTSHAQYRTPPLNFIATTVHNPDTQKSHIEFGDRDKVKEHLHSTQKDTFVAHNVNKNRPNQNAEEQRLQLIAKSHISFGGPSLNEESTWKTTTSQIFTPPLNSTKPQRYSMNLQKTHIAIGDPAFNERSTTNAIEFSQKQVRYMNILSIDRI